MDIEHGALNNKFLSVAFLLLNMQLAQPADDDGFFLSRNVFNQQELTPLIEFLEGCGINAQMVNGGPEQGSTSSDRRPSQLALSSEDVNMLRNIFSLAASFKSRDNANMCILGATDLSKFLPYMFLDAHAELLDANAMFIGAHASRNKLSGPFGWRVSGSWDRDQIETGAGQLRANITEAHCDGRRFLVIEDSLETSKTQAFMRIKLLQTINGILSLRDFVKLTLEQLVQFKPENSSPNRPAPIWLHAVGLYPDTNLTNCMEMFLERLFGNSCYLSSAHNNDPEVRNFDLTLYVDGYVLPEVRTLFGKIGKLPSIISLVPN